MEEEFESGWWLDYTTVIGYCVTWETCNCGQTTLMFWPNGKSAGALCPCLSCGDDTYTIYFLANVN